MSEESTYSAEEIARLFRREALVSDAELRIDAAGRVDRSAAGDDSAELGHVQVHVRGDSNELHAKRDRHAAGRYERFVDQDENVVVGEHYEERCEGGVDSRASIESQAIVGGAYAGVVAGPCLRISGWVDYLAWGAWSEADAARVEIAGVMARSLFAHCHFSGARVVRATSLIDDFATRIENFSAGAETYGTAIHIGAPGSGVTLET